ncbi:hypothetical protein ATY41_07350 [Leifsonia xyli subsp. xyli]|uniref:DUF2142 domain-containing protein n=2 Tax=Leifsonia xyli subsp. xyli TaxID=59736 RepID=Q6AGK9_LEIXX|nr:DUF2142 domain-containing protein [Leifsonia xyli]AAT88486.1 hypothetical protein Lxx05060 [Leifsonia xyli subsp. xyli str. CTCB07]ODA91031.1 hypothetical protein ATY41_07350 [Leifsonia xyli subsp. xyli]
MIKAAEGTRALRIVRIVLMPVLALLVFGAWALSSPPGSSPDDDFHQTSIWCADGIVKGTCDAGSRSGHYTVPPLVANGSCYAFKPHESASCQGSATRARTTDRGNFHGLYPPFYYAFMHTFVTGDVAVSIVAMRLVNAIIFVALTSVLCWLLPARRRWNLVWSLAITTIPLGLFLIPSVNPSSWVLISSGLVLLAVVGYFESTGCRRVGLGAVAVIAAFLGGAARSDGAVFSVLATGAAVLLTMKRDRKYWLSALLALGIVLLSAALFSTSHQSGTALSGGLASGGKGMADWSLWFPILTQLPVLWAGGLGAVFGLGWVDTHMPGGVWVVTIMVFAALVFAGVRILGLRKGLVLLGAAAALILLPFYLQVSTGTLVGNQVQPRYILPILIMFAAVALWESEDRQFDLTQTQWWVLAGGLGVAQALALHANLRRYVTGVDVLNVNLSASVEWWWNIPVSPMWLWVLASGAFVALMALIVIEFSRVSPKAGVLRQPSALT